MVSLAKPVSNGMKKSKTKKGEDYDDDDCEICKLMRKGGDVSAEELVKAMNLQNFMNNLPKEKGKKISQNKKQVK